MKRAFILLLVALWMPAAAMAATSQESFIGKLGQEAISLLADKKIGPAARRAQFTRLLTQNFDLKTIGRFVLGRHWRAATPAQQAQYQQLFEKMVVTVYTKRFDTYAGQTFTVKGSVPLDGGDTLVKSEIAQVDGPPVAVEWRVRGQGAAQKIIDVVVEGVSMSVTQRSEFDSVIANSGMDGLIADLRARTVPAKPVAKK